MANRFYQEGLKGFMGAFIDLTNDDIVASLHESATYTPNTAAGGHDFFDDVAGASLLAESSPLGSKTLTGGIFDAADATFTAVAGGDTGAYVILRQDTGVDSTSRLICIFDTGVNFPISTNGGDILVQWSNSTNKIFALFEGLSESDKKLIKHSGFLDILADFLKPKGWRRTGGGLLVPQGA